MAVGTASPAELPDLADVQILQMESATMNVSFLGRALLGTSLLAVLSACSTLTARSDSDAAANLGVCRSWSWMETQVATRPSPFDNPLNDKRVRGAITQRLQSRGMTLAESGPADCQVAYAFGARTTRDDYNRPRVSFGLGTGWGGWGRSGTAGSIFWDMSGPNTWRESRMSIDLYRSGGAAGREPLWHASVDTDVTQLTGAEAEKRIDAAVAAMFAKYPAAH
jgi:hypothetical protein